MSQRIFGTSMMFGIGTSQTRLHADSFTNLIGEDKNSWGLSHKGVLWHNGECTVYTKPFKENEPTTIGVFFDGINGTLTFYKDGVNLGVAFKGLNTIEEPLYPVVCSTAAKTEMVLKNMRRDYESLQDRCRSEILKKIKDRADMEQLLIPDSLKEYLAESMIFLEDNSALLLLMQSNSYFWNHSQNSFKSQLN